MIIEINNKEYELRFNINTLCEMSEQGFDVMDLTNVKINMRTVRDLFYYALKGGNKKITKNQAGELMDQYIEDGHNFDDLIEIVMDALGRSLGSKKPEDKEEGAEEGLQ
jgi:hypothetical protein